MNPPKKRTTGARIHGQHYNQLYLHTGSEQSESPESPGARLEQLRDCSDGSAAHRGLQVQRSPSECLPPPEVEKRTLNFMWNRHWIAKTVFKEQSRRTHACWSQNFLLWTRLPKPCGAGTEEQAGGTEFTTRVLHCSSEFWQRCRHLQRGKDLFIKWCWDHGVVSHSHERDWYWNPTPRHV